MHLVIVESPTKAKTIRKYLGSDYTVTASMGHVRDLPSKADEVPEKYKGTKWAQLGVDTENDFQPLYVISRGKSKTITELKQALKTAEDVYLATDEDREGESISWHLLQILKPSVPVHRMVFHEITKQAIENALAKPRQLDEALVHAQETRRILDRLVGYGISPVLWKKIAYGLSAGRVQSSALKAIVDRERARLAFQKGAYWDVLATLEQKESFEAKLTATDGKRVATGKDFDEQTGAVKAGAKDLILLDEAKAKAIAEQVKKEPWNVTDVQEKPTTRKPPAPFITSTLQQEANRKLGLSSKEAMKIAQGLYERGFITYMRTDSVALSAEALKGIKDGVEKRFGAEYVLAEPRHFGSVKGAQEAHEAIRPSLTFASPDETGLAGIERDVYELIWMRTLASQMPESKQLQVAVTLVSAGHTFTATGMRIIFPGFLRAYVEGADDIEQALEEKEKALPALTIGDKPVCKDATDQSHETKPPARFTEASLIQYMEREGIGRPSTYSSIISTLLDRGYVKKTANALVPTITAFAVTQFMERCFKDLVDVKFTSKMEQSLDSIAEGKEEWLPYLRGFYFGDNGLETRIKEELAKKDEHDPRTVTLPNLPDVSIHIGRFGPYFEAVNPETNAKIKASLAPELTPADLTPDAMKEIIKTAKQGPTTLGIDPVTGENIYLKTGSYGAYLELGEHENEELKDKKAKIKRVSVPKTIPLDQLTHELAVGLISLPRLLGTHPESGKEIRAGLGRFGPYIVHDGDFRSLKGEDNVLTVDLKRALEMLAEPKGVRGGRTAAILKTLGNHPTDGKPITLHTGRYGPYVKHGTINATIPKTQDPDTITLEQAVVLIKERKEKKK
ncbi:MAG: type I DNA topoisomerase [bacterium]|nr:type I DNA topoisomerase [bacterium]